jgi:hypothetical protein
MVITFARQVPLFGVRTEQRDLHLVDLLLAAKKQKHVRKRDFGCLRGIRKLCWEELRHRSVLDPRNVSFINPISRLQRFEGCCCV